MNAWQDKLTNAFDKKEKEEDEKQFKITEAKSQFAEFIKSTVRPAFEEVSAELRKHERITEINDNGVDYISITIKKGGVSGITEEELKYAITLPYDSKWAHPVPEIHFRDKKSGQFYRAEGHIRSGTQDYTVKDITKDDIINDLINDYGDHIIH